MGDEILWRWLPPLCSPFLRFFPFNNDPAICIYKPKFLDRPPYTEKIPLPNQKKDMDLDWMFAIPTAAAATANDPDGNTNNNENMDPTIRVS